MVLGELSIRVLIAEHSCVTVYLEVSAEIMSYNYYVKQEVYGITNVL